MLLLIDPTSITRFEHSSAFLTWNELSTGFRSGRNAFTPGAILLRQVKRHRFSRAGKFLIKRRLFKPLGVYQI